MTKEERRAAAAERPRANDGRRRDYLLPRDRGKVREYVRDLVDARRNIAGLLLPMAVLSFVILLVPVPVLQAYGPLVLLIAIMAAIIDSIFFGRQRHQEGPTRSSRRATTPGLSTKGSALGFYAFNRACLIRRWRVPKPRVRVGAADDRLNRSDVTRCGTTSGRRQARRPTRSCAGSSAPTAG